MLDCYQISGRLFVWMSFSNSFNASSKYTVSSFGDRPSQCGTLWFVLKVSPCCLPVLNFNVVSVSRSLKQGRVIAKFYANGLNKNFFCLEGCYQWVKNLYLCRFCERTLLSTDHILYCSHFLNLTTSQKFYKVLNNQI